MDTAALPADGLRQRAAVTRRTPLVLCDLVELYAAEVGHSRAAAAYDLERLFSAIDCHLLAPSDNLFRPGLYPSPLDPSVCWVGLAADPLATSNDHRVYARDLAGYFQQRKRGARSPATYVECGEGCSRHDASDAAVYFAPEPLARLIEASGHTAPAFLLREPAPAEAPTPALAAGAGRKRSASQAAPAPAQWPYMPPAFAAQLAAYAEFWANWTPEQRPPLQKTVSAFIAERMGLAGITRKTDELANAIRPLEAPTERGKRQPVH